MSNPFDIIDARLSNIENLLLDLKHGPIEKTPATTEYITRQEAADILHITLPTLLTWTLEGKVKGYRIGRRVLYKKNEVEQAVRAIFVNKKTR